MIRYVAPWPGPGSLSSESCVMILSQAVLEHVEDLSGTYRAMRQRLNPGGHILHQIDFGSNGLTGQGNGHWSCFDLAWRLLLGRSAWVPSLGGLLG